MLPLPGPLPTFGPLKDPRNRPRTIPVDSSVLDALSAHLDTYGEGPHRLVFTTATGGPFVASRFTEVWRPAAGPLGIEVGDSFHQLRHFYASTLIRHGCSVKEVQMRLGHRSAVMTLDVHGQLWDTDDDRTRAATAAAFTDLKQAASSLTVRTGDPSEDKLPAQDG